MRRFAVRAPIAPKRVELLHELVPTANDLHYRTVGKRALMAGWLGRSARDGATDG